MNTNVKSKVVHCASCKGFYSSKSFYAHKCVQYAASDKPKLNANHLHQSSSPQAFQNGILDRFRGTDIGNLCRNDAIM